MATLTKKTRARKSWSKGKCARVSQSADAVVMREDVFEISASEAAELVVAMKQPRQISPELRALVVERARRFVL